VGTGIKHYHFSATHYISLLILNCRDAQMHSGRFT